jgi:Icc-related predicted phosphoesterase
MATTTDGKLRVAAIGDLHVMEDSVAPYRELFTEISGEADVLVLCGDLTNFGKTREAEILAEDIHACSIPVVGVLGNHDYECGQPEEIARILHEAGMIVLDEQAHEINGVGFAGVKGFLGGFGRGELAPFGEPIIKAFVGEALNEARKLENGLRSLRTERSVAVLHYSPTIETLEGEPEAIFQYLGSARLADAIDRFDHVKAVVHGHAHHGKYEGRTPRGIPVYNVAQFVLRPLLGKPYAVIEV